MYSESVNADPLRISMVSTTDMPLFSLPVSCMSSSAFFCGRAAYLQACWCPNSSEQEINKLSCTPLFAFADPFEPVTSFSRHFDFFQVLQDLITDLRPDSQELAESA